MADWIPTCYRSLSSGPREVRLGRLPVRGQAESHKGEQWGARGRLWHLFVRLLLGWGITTIDLLPPLQGGRDGRVPYGPMQGFWVSDMQSPSSGPELGLVRSEHQRCCVRP